MTIRRVDVAVLGGGAVGLASAFALAEAGREVALFDPAPGKGASFGNAGGITPGWVAPTAMPSTIRALPRMLVDPLSPLAIRPAYLLKLLPWLLGFAAAALPARVEAVSKALAALTLNSYEVWADFAARTGVGHLLRRQGILYAYAGADSRAGAEAAHALRRKRGVAMQEVDGTWLRSFAPMLSPEYRYGVYSPGAGHAVDPGALCEGIAAAFEAKGGRIVREAVADLAADADGVNFRTAGASWRSGHFVLAAGAHSKPFAAKLGARVPLDVERGYHAMLPAPGFELPAQMIDGEGKYALTSMVGGLRLAGTVELGGMEAPPNYARAERLVANARRLLPALDARDATYWMGFRPSLPDGLPVIGLAPASPRAVLAFGHAHLGITLAAPTAGIVADLVAGRAPAVDLTPYSPTRYSGWF
ncbi:MAG: FAD-binding oxidoreductase [Rhodospirillales bacterium]|nr:FAD-binding oxidoreductase [Rhodospirillales bacterium]